MPMKVIDKRKAAGCGTRFKDIVPGEYFEVNHRDLHKKVNTYRSSCRVSPGDKFYRGVEEWREVDWKYRIGKIVTPLVVASTP